MVMIMMTVVVKFVVFSMVMIVVATADYSKELQTRPFINKSVWLQGK